MSDDDDEPAQAVPSDAESDLCSTASEAPPEDWNSDDEPPQDHVGDEQTCSRDGRVKKVICRTGRGLERPGQYDVVRIRWMPVPSGVEVGANTADGLPGWADAEEMEVRMGEDELPLAVELAVKCMRIGEVAEVSGPRLYAARFSPLMGRKLRSQTGKLPQQRGKVLRKNRFLPSAPRSLAALVRAQGKAARAAEQKPGQPSPENPPEQYKARAELVSIQTVRMLTEDRTVSKVVTEPGTGRRLPRPGDVATFSLGPASGGRMVRHVLQLGTAKLPAPGLEHVLASMKEAEGCVATLPLGDDGGALYPEDVPAAEGNERKVATWRYVPPEERKLDLRSAPELEAPRSEGALMPGETFDVSEEVPGGDGVLFLRLADGRGWVFDRKPGVGELCHRKPVAGLASQRLAVVMHRWQRRDQVPVPPLGAVGFNPDAQDRALWPALHKLEARPGPERLVHEVEAGCTVLVALQVRPRPPEGLEAAGDRALPRPVLLSWCVSEGTVPGYLDAAVASLRLLEVSDFRLPSAATIGTPTGPSFEGQTPLRNPDFEELKELMDLLMNSGPDDFAPVLGRQAVPGMPACTLRTTWWKEGDVVDWADQGMLPVEEATASFRLTLFAATEAPDACVMPEDEQKRYLDMQRAHGNALAKLGRYSEAAAAYTRALDSVRRTPAYKKLFPTERGVVQGAYSRDPAQDDKSLEKLSEEELQALRSGFVALHLNLALCASKQGRPAEARRHACSALGAEPDNAKALFRRGSACATLGEWDEALADLQRAAELNPQDRGIRDELSALQRRMKEHRAKQKSMFQKAFNPEARKDAKQDAER